MNKTILTPILTAFGATLCCTGPVLLLLFGSTSISLFSFLEPIRPIASVLAIGLLGFAYYKTTRKPSEPDCCDVDKEKIMKKETKQKRLLLMTAPVVLALVFFPYYGTYLMGNDQQEIVKEDGIVTEWLIEGMTCEMCAKGLEGGLSAEEGMIACTVNYDSETMACIIKEAVLTKNDIPSKVEQLGYKVRPDESKTLPKS